MICNMQTHYIYLTKYSACDHIYSRAQERPHITPRLLKNYTQHGAFPKNVAYSWTKGCLYATHLFSLIMSFLKGGHLSFHLFYLDI